MEAWRGVVANAYLYATRAQVGLSTFTEFTDGEVTPGERKNAGVHTLLDELVPLARAVKTLRD
ncbi:hypothetical protein [Mobilicoccus massiliensis]|uniref:hypothetical protein n=1 Tax=Mobilicoccus massiliensis TaxID=1522310 RepID=UPI001FE77507|nr:hypothetical protein [Mobilicoccus massiliensis]